MKAVYEFTKAKRGAVAEPKGKTRIALSFLKRKETEFEAIRREIESLRSDLESQPMAGQED